MTVDAIIAQHRDARRAAEQIIDATDQRLAPELDTLSEDELLQLARECDMGESDEYHCICCRAWYKYLRNTGAI